MASNNNNQWNLVTKSKKQKKFEKKVEARLEQKRIAAQLPKLEEILPSDKINNLLSGKKENKPNKTTNATPAKKHPHPNNNHNNNRQNVSNAKSKATTHNHNSNNSNSNTNNKSAAKQNKPKSLEKAIHELTVEEIKTTLEQLAIQFPSSELLWLKGLAAFLNTKLNCVCDPVFSGKSSAYPSCLLSGVQKAVLLEFLSKVGVVNLSYFFQHLLYNMANEMNNNLSVLGYKLTLQMIAQNWPQVCTDNMAKMAMLRNSYQNRPNICQSIFWAIGQAGFADLQTGIHVWHNLMLPNLEMRHYTKFCCDYMQSITEKHSHLTDFNMKQEDFFNFFQVLRYTKRSISSEYQNSLYKSAKRLLRIFVKSSRDRSNLFLVLLRQINNEPNKFDEMDAACDILASDDLAEALDTWRMYYKKHILQTAVVLKNLSTSWAKYWDIFELETFQKFLNDLDKGTQEMVASSKYPPHLDDLLISIELTKTAVQQTKKTRKDEETKKGGCKCCRWVLGSILLIGLIAGAIAFDTHINGKGVFAKSATGKALQNAGLLSTVEATWYSRMGSLARGYKWAEEHVPPFATPVINLACDLFKLSKVFLCNTFTMLKDTASKKLPVAAQFVEQYVPGLPQKIEDTSVVVKKVAADSYDRVLAFFQTQVLIGRFSPENLEIAFNKTQNMAADFYKEFSKKIDAYAKLK